MKGKGRPWTREGGLGGGSPRWWLQEGGQEGQRGRPPRSTERGWEQSEGISWWVRDPTSVLLGP